MGNQNKCRSVPCNPNMVFSFVLNGSDRDAPMFVACLALVIGLILLSTGNRAYAEQIGASSSTTETGHTKWSRITLDTADRIDRFFSNQNYDEEGQETRLRVYVKMRTDENNGQSLAAGIRGKLSLPRTERRL